MENEKDENVEEEIKQILPFTKDIKILKTPKGEGVAVIKYSSLPASQIAEGRTKLIRLMIEKGKKLIPVFMNDSEWKLLFESPAGERWLESLEPERGMLNLIKIFKGSKNYPKSLRKLAVRVIENYSGIIESLSSDSYLPPHMIFEVTHRMIDEVFEILFAMKGVGLSESEGGILSFSKYFADSKYFRADDAFILYELESSFKKCKNLFIIAGKSDIGRDEKYLLDKVVDFLSRCRKYVNEELTTEQERKREKNLFIGITSGVFLIIILLILWFWKPWDYLKPVNVPSAEQKRGGISGVYYSGKNFEKVITQKVDRKIRFRTYGSPVSGVPQDFFSVRWKGYIFFPDSGVYYVCTQSDDGVRVELGGRKIIEEWREKPLTEDCGKVRVKKGWHSITVEYFEAGGEATIDLLRGKKKSQVESVPAYDLCCSK